MVYQPQEWCEELKAEFTGWYFWCITPSHGAAYLCGRDDSNPGDVLKAADKQEMQAKVQYRIDEAAKEAWQEQS
jgi:hypothetical protein